MILGIDIGGTNIKFGVVDKEYNIIKKYSIPTQKDKGDIALVWDIINKSKEICEEFMIDSIGIGTPGTVDYTNGICIRASNLPYNNTPIKEMVEKELMLPVSIANDATAAVYGELYSGHGKNYKNLIMVTIGTGIGGGIIINGRPYLGSSGGAGEIGHVIIDKDGELCKCGQKGCWEMYASVSALISQTRKAAEIHPESKLAELCQKGITGQTVFDAVKNKCVIAAEVLDSYLDYLATGIVSLVRIFHPDAVVLGGAVTNEGDLLLSPLKEKITIRTDIFISDLKNDAGIIGAAVKTKEI